MFKIITDSAADFFLYEAKDLNIGILPLKITFGDDEYLDGVTISHDEFFEKLLETGDLPHTSQITPYEYSSVFAEATANGEEVVCITLSSKLSGCYSSAVVASDDFEEKVFVVDSENACIGQRILVEMAVLLRDKGLTASEAVAILNEEKKKICLVALLDTLEYLKKGGRISSAVAIAGTLLSIKPVITIKDGEVALLGKARGSKKGNNLLTEFIDKAGGIDFNKPYHLAYSGLTDIMLKKYVEDSHILYEAETDNLPASSIGAAIGTHIGPGAIAAAFFKK